MCIYLVVCRSMCVSVPADPAVGCVGVVLDGDDSPVGATGAAGSAPPTLPSLSTGIPYTHKFRQDDI